MRPVILTCCSGTAFPSGRSLAAPAKRSFVANNGNILLYRVRLRNEQPVFLQHRGAENGTEYDGKKEKKAAKTSGFLDSENLILSSQGKRRLPSNSICKDFRSRCNILRNLAAMQGTRINISVNISPLMSKNTLRMLINRHNVNNVQITLNF